MSDYESNFYDYEEIDIYKRIYRISSDFNVGLQFLTVAINFFHLTVLFRKELRTGAIYILMIGISLADLTNFLLDFFTVAVERRWWIPKDFNSYCLNMDWMVIPPLNQFFSSTVALTRPVAVWLAIYMALIRTLSVMLPTSKWMQRMTNPSFVVWVIVVDFLVWTVFYNWNLVFLRVVWYPDVLDKKCIYYSQHVKQKQSILVISRENREYEFKRDELEPYVRFLPTICYPILTIALLIQLRTIKKKQKKESKNSLNDRSDNTTKLILFMTICFMLSEGLDGLNRFMIQFLINSGMDMTDDWNVELISTLGSLQYICNNLRTINATSHFFVCYLMSSQYRQVLKNMFCWKAKKHGRNIHLSKTSFAIFTILKTSGVSQQLGVWLITFYCSSYAMLLSLLSIQFFYRYTSVTAPLNTSRFSRKTVPFYIFYVIGFFTIWALLTYFINGPSDMKNQEFWPDFQENYCLGPSDFAYIGAKYYYFSQGELQYHWPSFFCISTMSTLLCSTFSGMTYFGTCTFKTLKKVGLTSYGSKELQNQLFRTLVVQTIIPSIFMYFPVSCMFLFPMIGLEIEEVAIFIPITVSIYPCLEPMVAMYCIKDFRLRIYDILTCSRTLRAQVSSTQRESFF